MSFGRKVFVYTMLIIAVGLLVHAQGVGDAGIQGRVFKSTSTEPVERSTVVITSDSGSQYSATTDSSGTFNFKGIPAGHYTLSASRLGFRYDAAQQNSEVVVLPRQQLAGVQIRLTPSSSISGRVLDRKGQPLPGMTVLAMRPNFINGRRVLLPDVANTRFFFPIGAQVVRTFQYPKAVSDDQGNYRISGLPPGTYYVSVWSAGAETLEDVTSRIFESQGYTKDQPPVFYPGVIDPSLAVALEVKGTDRQGLDIQIRDQALLRFRFEIVSPPAAANCALPGSLGNPEVFVLIRHTQKLDVAYYTSRFGNVVFKKGPNSQWISPPLSPGSYEVFYNPCIRGDSMVGSLKAEIVDRDVDAGKLVLSPNASVNGHMFTNRAPSMKFDGVRVRLRPLDLRTAAASMAPNPIFTQGDLVVSRDGTFSFDIYSAAGTRASAAPGLYQIDVAGLPENVYVASVKVAGREVRDTGFRVNSDYSGPVEISLSEGAGVVQGAVKDQFGRPVIGAVVALMPSNRDLVYSNLFKEARTGQDGNFKIVGIPPGDYAIVAVADFEVAETRSAEFRDEYQTRTLRVPIKEGSLENLSLTIASP